MPKKKGDSKQGRPGAKKKSETEAVRHQPEVDEGEELRECVFHFLLVLDVEATCVEDMAAQPDFRPEIIELPVVVVDVRPPLIRPADRASRSSPAPLLGTVCAAFRTFVRPTEWPALTPFCTVLTGIDQDTVDAAPTLPDALSAMDRWIHRTLPRLAAAPPHSVVWDPSAGPEGPEPDLRGGASSPASPSSDLPRFAFATDGPWDLYHFLHIECERKGIAKAMYLETWINLRWLFASDMHPGRKRLKVRDTLDYLGLPFDGREHAGLDDSRNIAKIAQAMLAHGVTLRVNDGVSDVLRVKWKAPAHWMGAPEALTDPKPPPPAADVEGGAAAGGGGGGGGGGGRGEDDGPEEPLRKEEGGSHGDE
jgi:inhibitor of KinA sporulation pathway (predicted exonuclease)